MQCEKVFCSQTKNGNDGICISNSEKSRNTRLGPGDEKKCYGTLPYTPEGKCDSTATQMVEQFKDTGHPVFKSISALSRRIPKKEGWQRHNTLQCGCCEHRALIPNHSLSESAQYLMSSFELV